MPEDATKLVIPRPAATVALVRQAPAGLHVLLTHRPASMAFAGDMHVFPGGAVDAADDDPRLRPRSSMTAPEAFERLGGDPSGRLTPAGAFGLHVAAIRELFEEAGVLLAEPADGRPIDPAALSTARSALVTGDATLADVTETLGLRLRTDLLAPISHWTTPPVMPRRFDTRFFVAELPDGIEPTFTTGEVQAHRWLTPAAALRAMAAGEIGLWPPTSATLQQLEHVASYTDVVERLAPGRLGEPGTIVEDDDVVRIVLGGAGGVPGQTVNCYLVGRREIVVVDPGDPSDVAAEAILAAVARRAGRVAGIAVTHVDPDHAAGAEPLGLRLGLRVVVGTGGGRLLSSDVDEVGDGQRFATGDVALTALATPGPRADHVAYLIGPSRDVLAGDLVGGRGSRSILGPADDAAWRRSLDRLRDLGPQRVFPGHGEPLGVAALGPVRLSEAGTQPGSAGS